MLIGQFSTNTLTYCTYLLISDLEIIELFPSGDNESEEEDKKKDRFETDTIKAKFYEKASLASVLFSEDYLSLNSPETITPPPEHFFLSKSQKISFAF